MVRREESPAGAHTTAGRSARSGWGAILSALNAQTRQALHLFRRVPIGLSACREVALRCPGADLGDSRPAATRRRLDRGPGHNGAPRGGVIADLDACLAICATPFDI